MTIKKKFKKSARENLDIGSRSDALTRYMSEISKIKPLTRDEECKLGHQIAEGDIAALQKLVQRNLKYVVSIANKYRGCGLSLQDLIEEGNIGIIQAAKRFDPSREVKFITYAVWWIKQAIPLPCLICGRASQATCQTSCENAPRAKNWCVPRTSPPN